MKTIIMLAAAILVVGCAHGGGAKARVEAQAQAAKDEADLAAALHGRVAGPPQDCVDLLDLGDHRSYGRSVILFSDRLGGVVFVNRLAGPCPGLTAGWALKTRTPTTQLCRGDIVTVFDPMSGTEYGGCGLGAFTPYRRAR